MPSFLKRVARPSDAEPSVFADAGEGRVGAVSTNSLQPIIFSLYDNGPSVRWDSIQADATLHWQAPKLIPFVLYGTGSNIC